jgi:hypothetical protein
MLGRELGWFGVCVSIRELLSLFEEVWFNEQQRSRQRVSDPGNGLFNFKPVLLPGAFRDLWDCE